MRITPNTTMDNSLFNIQRTRASIDQLQEHISSGNNFNRPSDDPVSVRLLVGLNDKMTAADQYNSNIGKADTWFQITNSAITGITDFVEQAKKTVASLSGGLSDPNVTNNALLQLNAIKQQIVDMGNTQMNGIYIFGGTNNLVQPFSASGYAGDSGEFKIEINQGVSQSVNIPGNYLLLGSAGSPYGSTDILGTLDQLITDVSTANQAGVETGKQALYQAGIQLNAAQSDLQSRLVRIDAAKTMNQNIISTFQSVYGNLQNVDYAQMGIEMSQQQTALEATLSATAKISQMSLLDYL